jgi:hypothetical protein
MGSLSHWAYLFPVDNEHPQALASRFSVVCVAHRFAIPDRLVDIDSARE